MKEKLVECFMNEELNMEMYIIPYRTGVYFNYNDICDMLNIPYKRRVNRIKQIEEIHKSRVLFQRNGRDSEETFISTPEVSRLLTDYSKEVYAMMERKYSVETLVYDILRDFDRHDEMKEENVNLGDKFILNTLYCDSVIADKSNKNLIDLLRKNELMETIIHHQTNIDRRSRLLEREEVNEFIKLAEEIDKANNRLLDLTNDFGTILNIDFNSIAKASGYDKYEDYDESGDEVVKRV